MSLPDKIVAVHHALEAVAVPHAFGGALALAWCTERARGTVDLDLNVFVTPDAAAVALEALPTAVRWDHDDLARIAQDGQARLWWDDTPLDLFFNTTPFHEHVATRVRSEPFLDEPLPFLACHELAVFKALFTRTRDWADIEEMVAAATVDPADVVAGHVGDDDPRVRRLRSLA